MLYFTLSWLRAANQVTTRINQSRVVWKSHRHTVSGHDCSSLYTKVFTRCTAAPVFDELDLGLRDITIQGALQDNTSIYRLNPSPEVDAAWNRISMEGLEILTVPSSAITRSGKDVSSSVKAPFSWGEGSDSYLAQVEVFHQIHCLNELRKEIFYDYYYNDQPDDIHRAHKAHCIHVILQSLMCTADVGIIQHNWVYNGKLTEPQTRPFPDFSTEKTCRDFDAILKWATSRSVSDLSSKWHALRIPDGAHVIAGDGYI